MSDRWIPRYCDDSSSSEIYAAKPDGELERMRGMGLEIGADELRRERDEAIRERDNAEKQAANWQRAANEIEQEYLVELVAERMAHFGTALAAVGHISRLQRTVHRKDRQQIDSWRFRHRSDVEAERLVKERDETRAEVARLRQELESERMDHFGTALAAMGYIQQAHNELCSCPYYPIGCDLGFKWWYEREKKRAEGAELDSYALAERMRVLEKACTDHRDDLLREIAYPHWNDDQRMMLNKTLKWFAAAVSKCLQ